MINDPLGKVMRDDGAEVQYKPGVASLDRAVDAMTETARNQNEQYGSGSDTLPIAIAAFVGVAIGMGCPIHLLDRVWGVMVAKSMPRTPYECADQIRQAMRQCGIVC
jgi:hypothetical protein